MAVIRTVLEAPPVPTQATSVMFNTILLAIDSEGLAEGTIPVVAALAKRSPAPVVVLHVRDGFDPRERDEASELVDTAAGQLRALGVDAVGQVRRVAGGSLGRAIAEAVDELEADLVAIGSRGRGDLAGMLLGSVGHEVAAGVSTPVLVVRPPVAPSSPASPPKVAISRILVAVSVNEPEATAQLGGRIAAGTGAKVLVLHVKETVAMTEGAVYIEPDHDAVKAVETAEACLRTMGVPFEAEIFSGIGSVAQAIVETADRWDADLIVLGSRRPTGLNGLLLGSVAHQVIHRTRRPVVLADAAERMAKEKAR